MLLGMTFAAALVRESLLLYRTVFAYRLELDSFSAAWTEMVRYCSVPPVATSVPMVRRLALSPPDAAHVTSHPGPFDG